ncbi:hypothetical protein [Saccharomonospora azurea]|uniref:hypothetical protein n=1 Tax=Saccharomonospora azurea TaxID=40988 RepID=UPI003D8CE39A
MDQRLARLSNACNGIDGEQLHTVASAISSAPEPPTCSAKSTPEWATAVELPRERHEDRQHTQNLLTPHHTELNELYGTATARYLATAAAVVTTAATGEDPLAVLDAALAALDEHGLAPDAPCPVTGLDALDRDIATAHRAATTGPQRARRRADRAGEEQLAPAGVSLGAVLSSAQHLHRS